MNMENNCILKLNHLLFDEITFNRVNFKSKNDLQVEFGFSFNKREYGEFVSSIRIIGTKKDEYNFVVRASGYFQISEAVEAFRYFIQQNAIAIVFPYIRSQISLLTATAGSRSCYTASNEYCPNGKRIYRESTQNRILHYQLTANL